MQARFAIGDAVDAASLSDIQQTDDITTFVTITPDPVHVHIRETPKIAEWKLCTRLAALVAVQSLPDGPLNRAPMRGPECGVDLSRVRTKDPRSSGNICNAVGWGRWEWGAVFSVAGSLAFVRPGQFPGPKQLNKTGKNGVLFIVSFLGEPPSFW